MWGIAFHWMEGRPARWQPPTNALFDTGISGTERFLNFHRNSLGNFGEQRLLPLLIMIGLASAVCLGQKPIRVTSALVHVAFTARDVHGALVDNLTQDEIEVSEDGALQKLAYFARSVDVPLTLGLIVDESGSQESEAKRHRHDMEIFLKDVLGPKDRVFLVTFGNRIQLVSDFAPSGAELLDRWGAYEGDSFGVKKGKKDKPSGPAPKELGPIENRVLGTAFYDSIFYSVAEKMDRENGRRALLVFSDGEDNSSSHDMMTTIEAAQSADVLVFTIRYTEENHGKLTARNKYGISVMERIAKETGAEQFDAKATNPHEYFKQIGEELRTSYEIGYYSTNTAKDDTFRKVVIKPAREGVKVRAKPGYYAR